MKTLLILCLALIGLAGFTPAKASAAQTLPAVAHENVTVYVDGHRHHRYYHHRYHHRRYYYRHHRRYYY